MLSFSVVLITPFAPPFVAVLILLGTMLLIPESRAAELIPIPKPIVESKSISLYESRNHSGISVEYIFSRTGT